VPINSLRRAAVEAMRHALPEALPDRLTVTVTAESLGLSLTVTIEARDTVPSTASPGAFAPPAAQLNDRERDVLEALGDATLTGQELATRAGYEYDKEFRELLATMRRHGLLGGEAGARGYSRGPAAPPTG